MSENTVYTLAKTLQKTDGLERILHKCFLLCEIRSKKNIF